MIEGIQRDPTDIMGWYEKEALVAWKNIFPLTKVSARLGYLPIEDVAWIKTPNPYWHFLMDRPTFPPLTNMISVQQGSPFWKHLCEESMSALETILLERAICQRKILQEKPVEMVVIGNLFLVKLLQFSMPMIACTLNILSNQSQFRILRHTVNLFPGLIKEKFALRQAWTLRETREKPSLVWFDASCTPNPIMNILIWNLKG